MKDQQTKEKRTYIKKVKRFSEGQWAISFDKAMKIMNKLTDELMQTNKKGQ